MRQIIFIFIIFFVILILFQIFKNLNESKNIQIKQEFDIIIIGAGVTGAYLSNRLSNQFPEKKILILEKNEYIGGRLISVKHKKNLIQNPFEIADEHGGMRFFPIIHPSVNKIINLLNLETVIVPYVNDTNLFYTRNTSFKNNSIFPETDKLYILKEYEKNQDVRLLVERNILNVLQKFGVNIHNLLKYKKILYNNTEITSLNFKHEITNGLIPISRDNWKRFLDITGYSNIFEKNTQFLCACIEEISLSNKTNTDSEKQHFVKNGYQQIPIKLLNNFNKISFSDLETNNVVSNNLFINNSNFHKFKKTHNNKVSVYVSDVNTNKKFNLTTQNLYICTPKDSINNIEGFDNNFNYLIKQNIKELPLFKIFLKYNNNWWNSIGFYNGRSTTDLQFGQLWFYNNNTLMTYAVSDQAEYWSSLIPYNNQFDFIPINNQTNNMINILIDMYKQFFKNYNIVIPLPDEISWSYYSNGASLWQSGNFEKSTNEIIKNLTYINKNVCYLNNDVSLNQGWVEGCFEIVDDFIKEKYNMPGILDDDFMI